MLPTEQNCQQNGEVDHELSALPEYMVGQILNIMDAAPAVTTYTFLWAHMLETSSLSDYEKWDMLKKMEQMGGRKPSKLLVDMMKVCPARLEQSLPFHYLFTRGCPGPCGHSMERWILETRGRWRNYCGPLMPLPHLTSHRHSGGQQWSLCSC